MNRKVKLILGLFIIFGLGIVTGASISPFFLKHSTGNPYSLNVLSDRIYNVGILKDVELNSEQIEEVSSLVSKYVSKYTVERDFFIGKRRMLYSEFKYHLSDILTPQQYAYYESNSDEIMRKKEVYVKSLENKWETERNNKKEQRLVETDSPTFKNIILDKEMSGDANSNNANSNKNINVNNDSNVNVVRPYYKTDFINRYLIDKAKNKWKTYSIYEDVESNYQNLD